MQKKIKFKNNYTIILFSLFIISISCLIFIEKAQAASFYFENQLNGYIEPKPATSTAFTLPIHISEADDVNRIKISIDFKHPNSDVVFYDGYEILDFFSSSTCPLTATSSIATTTETNMIEIDIQRSCGSGITGSGDVINLIFHASTTPGTTEVSSPSAHVYKTGTTTAEYSSFSRALIYIEGYDYINPVISNVHISGNSYKASELYLSWETDEPTIGQVSYRPAMVGESYITTALTEIYSTSTSMTITNLIPDTRYEFRINSYDLNENADLSYNHSFKTYAADTISFASNYYLYSENKDIPLEINIENVNNPNYIDFTFNYDPAVAEFKNIVLGDFFSDCVIASSSENTTGTVVVELTNNCATSTSGLLATINIKSLFVTSACDLTFTNGETRASNDSVIESFWNDSSLGVVSTDISPPEITLTGANPMYLDYSEYYSEPGFTVTDNIDDESQISTSTNIHISYFSSGSDYITYTATDKAGNTATATRTVIVEDANTIPPEIILEGDNPMYIGIGQWYNEPGYSASDDIDENITVILGGTINTWLSGTYDLTYTVTDSSLNTTVATRTIIVRGSTNPPEIILEGNNPMYIDLGSTYTEPGYSVTDDGTLIGSMATSSDLVTSIAGSYYVTYTITDNSDNTTVATRTVIVRNADTVPPEITLEGDNPMYINLGGIYTEPDYSATDNIDGAIPIENIATSSNLNASTTGSYYVTYIVSDSSGNTTIATRTVMVRVDTTLPIITLIGSSTVETEIYTDYIDAGATALDTWDGNITGNITSNLNLISTSTIGSYIITYSVNDAAGNSTTTTRTVNVVDTTSPVITLTGPSTIEIEVGSEYTEQGATATDNYDSICNITREGSVLTTTVGSYTITYNVTDTSGNPAIEVIRTVNVVDTPPALYCGDGDCNNGETCSTCPADCGRCRRGGGGGRSVTPPKDITPDPLAKISNTTAERTDDSIILNWTNPTDADFKETVIIKLSKSIAPHLSYEELSLLGEVVYQGTDEYYKDLDIEKNIDYYYAIFTVDINNKYSDSVVIEKKHLFSNNNDTIDYGKIKNLANITSELVEKISLCEAKIMSAHNRHVDFNDDSRRLYLFIIDKAKRNLSENDKFSLAFYIHEGSQTTKILGAGERTGVLNSYLSVFGRLPETEADWQDVIKIANGRWPTERNLDAELLANKSHFVKVYLREPNMDNANDNAAVTIITYGLRPADRNLDNEKVAIKTFKHIYGHNPSSAIDWDITRAIAYSGAFR